MPTLVQARPSVAPAGTLDLAGLALTVSSVDATSASVAIAGELDLASGPVLEAFIEGQLDAGRRYLRLDLGGVTFLDSFGLGAVVRAHRACLDAGGTLVVVRTSVQVRRVVALLGAEIVLFVAERGITGG